MNKRTLKRAIGVSNGKSLTIANDCAKCVISLERDDPSFLPGGRVRYHVSGDVPEREKTFDQLDKALAYALEGLALYMDGSPNR